MPARPAGAYQREMRVRRIVRTYSPVLPSTATHRYMASSTATALSVVITMAASK
jgi:hypothetical protein